MGRVGDGIVLYLGRSGIPGSDSAWTGIDIVEDSVIIDVLDTQETLTVGSEGGFEMGSGCFGEIFHLLLPGM
jgi:hypothetical protein